MLGASTDNLAPKFEFLQNLSKAVSQIDKAGKREYRA